MNLKRFFYVSILLAFVMNILNIHSFVNSALGGYKEYPPTTLIGLEKPLNNIEDLNILEKYGYLSCKTLKDFPNYWKLLDSTIIVDSFILGKINNLFIPKVNNLFIPNTKAQDNIVNFRLSFHENRYFDVNGKTNIEWLEAIEFDHIGHGRSAGYNNAFISKYDDNKYAIAGGPFVYKKETEVHFIKKEDFKRVISDLSYDAQVEAIQKYNPDGSCGFLPSKGKINILHLDIDSGNPLDELESYSKDVGENYETNKREFKNYEFIQVEGEESGEYIAGQKNITYLYKKLPYEQRVGELKVFYKDAESLEEISPRESFTGKLDTDYQTQVKDLDNYEFVRVEGSENGNFTEDEQVVIYFYKKKETPKTGKITVKYLEELTNKELSAEESFSGEINISYQTNKKEIQDYEFVKVEGNENGQYSKNEQIITYFYKKKEVKSSTGTGTTTGRTFKSGIDHKYNPETENYKIPEKTREKRVYNLINNESPKVEEKHQEKEIPIPEKPKIENNTKTKIEKQKEIKEKIQEIKENKTQTKIIKFPKKLPKTGADFRELFENKFDFN